MTRAREASVKIEVHVRASTGEVYESVEWLALTGDQVDAINNERQMGVAPWVKACCEIDLDVLSTRTEDPDNGRK